MKVKLLADRAYRRAEHIRWRGKRAGVVVGLEVQPDQPRHAVVEVPDVTVKEMERTGAARFILDRGNMVEVYER
jgi:hypothetical protein